MGRKGMKGFMKSAMARKPGEAEDAAEEGAGGSDHEQQQQPSSPLPKKAPPPPPPAAAAPAAVAPPTAGSDNDEDDDNDHASGPETRGHMVQRHKREVVAFKRASQRGKSKAEAAKALADLEARHAKELAEFDKAAAAAAGGGGAGAGAGASASAAASAGDRASKYLAGVSLADGAEEQHHGSGGKGPSKAQKRRDKLAAREAERDARIAAELAALGPTERAQEAAALRELLAPLGLAVKSIRADGHCLYHSVADQLKQLKQQQDGADDDAPDYLGLRRLAAAHMRAHRADFEPFVLAGDHGESEAVPRGWAGENQGEGEEEEEEEDKNKDAFSRYVDAVEKTAAWGGHVELTALAAALKRRIRVVAVGMPEVTAGEEQRGDPLTVCYVRHEFGLGEHYNSVRPKGEDEEEDEEEGAAAQEAQQEEEE